MKITVTAAMAAALILASHTGFAQTGPPEDTKKDAQFVTVQPEGQWLASRFIGQAVTNQAGENIVDIKMCCSTKLGAYPPR